ncbi:MAG: hypothetical protein CM1200mP41_13610 [Gammaproteobacteria bacterium]|nr:MAG: hypothetical protein CM1200mP41_13610 [Gammaproteobacteria bacterium]
MARETWDYVLKSRADQSQEAFKPNIRSTPYIRHHFTEHTPPSKRTTNTAHKLQVDENQKLKNQALSQMIKLRLRRSEDLINSTIPV